MLSQVKIVTSDCHVQRMLISASLKTLFNGISPLSASNLIHNKSFGTPASNLYDNSRRNFHKSCPCERFYESNPRGDYKDKKLHAESERVVRENLYGFKDGFKDLREEIGKWATEWKDRLGDDAHIYVNPGDKSIVWKFENKSVLQDWSALCDADHNEGFSKCELTMSPTGKGLFHGFVNTTPPKDGRIKYAGFCVMKSNRPYKSFRRKSYLDWSDYTHLIMRVRGDGRSYVLNISTAGFYDITWNDSYHYVLYTRGGPYWQYVKIPFGKFLFGSKGRAQDMQESITLTQIASFQIAAGKVDGPFCLEVDYIGLESDPNKKEEFAYEMYRIPKFIANV